MRIVRTKAKLIRIVVLTLIAENIGVARRHALIRVMGHKKV
jgi:hypothetical protein